MALNIDIAPTVLELAGIKTPTGMQGKSLMPLVTARKPSGANLAGTNLSWRKEFFCEHLLVDKDIPQWEGVRGERYVYARYFGQAPAYEFLHDLKSDPLELKNLASNHSYKKVLDKMRQRNIQLKRENGGEYSIEKFPLLPKKNGQQ
jgi:arylsulfatase A-like enzyme